MNYDRFNSLKFRVNNKRNEINNIKEVNKTSEKLTAQSNEIGIKLKQSMQYYRILEKVLLATKKEDNRFKQDRLAYLEEEIKKPQENIFDTDSFDIKLTPDTYRNKPIVKLKISQNGAKYTNPKNSSGGLGQQLISFSSSMTILTLLGKNKAFIDEAFGASSTENLGKVGNILEPYPRSGMQIILISQSGALYQDLPRREIKIVRENDEARVVSTTDWGE